MDRLTTVLANIALFSFAYVGLDHVSERWLGRLSAWRQARRQRDVALERMTEQAFARAKARDLYGDDDCPY